MKLIRQTEQYIRANRLFTLSDQLLIGLSGGMDSVVLLHLLLKLGYNCIAVHCNFNLRGNESNRDESFVRQLCVVWGVDLYVEHFDTSEYAKSHKISIEMAARELRYELFEELLSRFGCDRVVVAHHKDDTIETVLMNFVRGAGVRGIAGIQPQNGHIIRPLLHATRDEICKYAESNKLDHVFDSSNNENEYKRNKIRNQLIPLLKQLNPSYIDSFMRTIENMNSCLSIYKHEIEKQRKLIVRADGATHLIRISDILSYIEPFTLLFELLTPYEFNRTVVKQLFDNLNGEAGHFYFSNDYRVEKGRTDLIISPLSVGVPETLFHIDVSIDGKINLINQSIKWTLVSPLEFNRLDFSPRNAYIDWGKLRLPIVIRKWRKGDSFYPVGMNGRKKISDWFANNKMNQTEKENTLFLCSGDDIVWIIGHRIDRRFRVTPNTTNGIIFREIPIEE